uniref:Hypothetical conserved protein n=2 Tax=Candidatus Bipolaricaulota TaxID=67810 RepID=H5SNI7_9BACT|nr:hypothetical conserved protein [uncultured Acetothermia bacterium]BAL59051.1 hypothetical conserved protein [Candidatus Acetothermum autotrophicum]
MAQSATYFGCGSVSAKKLLIEGSGNNSTNSAAQILWVRDGTSGDFLSFDSNEIQAFDSGGSSDETLYLQDFGGDVNIGNGSANGADVYVDADMYVSSEVIITGRLEVRGEKRFVEPHPLDPSKEIVYSSLEGPEVGTYFRGTAHLQDGEAKIELPQHFDFVTEPEGLTVHLTPVGEWLQLYVVQKSTKQIIVREAQGKNGTFDFLIQGIRKGYRDSEVIRDRRVDEN